MLRFRGSTSFTLVVTSRATTTTTIKITGATREGAFTLKHSTLSDLSEQVSSYNIPDMPIWISVEDENDLFSQRNCYVSVGLALNGDVVYWLTGGYISRSNTLSWPNSNIVYTLPPDIGTISLDWLQDPAAGAQISTNPVAGRISRIKGLYFTLVTDATVASRRVHIKFHTYFECISSVDQTASTTRKYHCLPMGAVGTYADDDDIIIPIPHNMNLADDDSIQTTTTNMQAGDNFGPIYLWSEQFTK